MKVYFTFIFLCIAQFAQTQLVTSTPDFIRESTTPADIIIDATKGNQALKDYNPASDVYVHIGVITNFSTSSSDWQHAGNFAWGTTNPAANCTYLGNDKWKYTITGGLRTFFNVTNSAETIYKIAVLFRNGNGSIVQRNSDGSDLYVPVYDNALQVRLTDPPREPRYVPVPEMISKNPGDLITLTAKSSENADLKLYYNGIQAGLTTSNGTSVAANATVTTGTQTIIAEAKSGTVTKYDTIQFFVAPAPVTAAQPAGTKDGINYEPGDTSATLVLYAPGKTRIALVGDFNNWSETLQQQMNRTPDGNKFWLRLTGLIPSTEYAYQYLIDGSLKVADYNCEKVLDPSNDQYIPASTYPNLKPYPAGKTTGIVSVLQTNKPQYNWQVQNFVKPDKRNLVIYEMLVRDFVAAQNWQTVTDTLSYLKRLGINAIEIMPSNEFEGNNSWGYNSSFFFAPDKAYGTENALRRFIDECHKQGIAVIMDVAMNHAFGQSPTVQMYFNGVLNRPAANNPWHNELAKHPYNVGYDFNHESQATKDLVDRVVENWLLKYKVDGFRWDLSKGFTQTNSCTTANCNQDAEVANWSSYDATRTATWKRIFDKMQSTVSNSYCILEHFAANTEEIELSNYGMLLWGNANYNFNEATMGYVGTSNFEGAIYRQRGWSQPNLVTYQESHDEERLMYKNLAYGNASGTYNVKDLNTALKRNEMAAAFWAMIPGPKMMWQFAELGYDYSINYCENGTINANCRTNPKPIRWDYQGNTNRVALYNVYSKLLKLRNVPNFLPTFVTSDISWNLSGGFKSLQVSSDSLKICVIGNFDVTTATGVVTFQNPGTWYDYLSGGTRIAGAAPDVITLQPGEYYVYTNRNVNPLVAALPLKLLSFQVTRHNGEVAVSWVTASEVNVKTFHLERSQNGTDYENINVRPALNRSVQAIYTYNDKDDKVLNATGKLFYRLKIIDADGKISYSNTATVNPVSNTSGIVIYPNPVAGSQLFVKLNASELASAILKIEDAAGRVYQYVHLKGNNAGFITLNIGQLANGVYLLKTHMKDRPVIIKRFTVQR